MSLWTVFRVLQSARAHERSSRWTRAQLESHQAQRLLELRRFVQTNSPFYRRFHAGSESRPLGELPILSKTMLMENFDELVTDRTLKLAALEEYLARQADDTPLFRRRFTVLSTSGSTGQRGIFVFDRREWTRALGAMLRPILSWQQSGGQRAARIATVMSRVPWHYSARAVTTLSSRLIPPTLRIDAATPLEEMIRKLNDWQPDALTCYPSVLRELSEAQIAGRLRISLRHINTSAEVLTDSVRSGVSEAWGSRVYNTYGATEYAPIASECASGNLHLFEDGAIIEVVDASGRPVPDGEPGERVLLTVLARRVQPLIRYELSDVLRVRAAGCDCGRPFRIVEAIEGRIEDVLVFERSGGGEVAIHPNLFHQVLEAVPATSWQVIQYTDALVVNLVGLRDEPSRAAISTNLKRALESLGASVPPLLLVRMSPVERGATGKAPLIWRRSDTYSQPTN